MKIKFDPRVFIRVKTQLVLMAITFACMSFMIYQAIAGFNPAGKLPPANDYNNQKFFEKFHVNPARIKTGITLLNFLKFESEQNDFAFDAMMSFDYNPLEISPKIVDRFEFTRAKFLDKYIRDEVKKSPTHTRVEYYVRVQFSVDFFDHERFPFDDHILHINLINPGTDAKEVMYEMEPKKFILSSNLTVPGWDIICHQGRPAFRLHEDGDNVAEPILTFSLCLAKRDARHAALIFLPLFLIFFGGFFALSIKNPLTGLDMARSSVVGLLAYDYIIINISPKTAFFMISDYLFLVFLIESFSIYLILFYCHYNVRQEYQEMVKGWASPIIILSLLCVWYYLVHFKGIYH